jgi:hypothetical protein
MTRPMVVLQQSRLGTDIMHYRVAIRLYSDDVYAYLSIEDAQDLLVQLMRELSLAEQSGYKLRISDEQPETEPNVPGV